MSNPFMLLLLLLAGSLRSFSQKIVKEHYTVSGGLLGAMNFSKLRTSGNNAYRYDTRSGCTACAWVKFSIGKHFSIDPQLHLTQLKMNPRQ